MFNPTEAQPDMIADDSLLTENQLRERLIIIEHEFRALLTALEPIAQACSYVNTSSHQFYDVAIWSDYRDDYEPLETENETLRHKHLIAGNEAFKRAKAFLGIEGE